jgi:tRNA pseudouridine38-40 synthase
MHNIKLTLAYDGSNFSGWQIQPGRPTVQGTLVEVAARLTQERLSIHGAGRTDAGVHALGQVAHFHTSSELTAQEFQRAFNALLPPTIRVLEAEEMGPDFHARWQAQAKTYQYRIYRGPTLPPSAHRYVLHDPDPLDVYAMASAAALFEGQHDFTSFAASPGGDASDSAGSLVRDIFHSRIFARRAEASSAAGFLATVAAQQVVAPAAAVCRGAMHSARATGTSMVEAAGTAEAQSAREQATLEEQQAPPAGPAPEELIYEVRGRSFLRYMVRKLVGTLLEVGRGRIPADSIPEIFTARDRSRSGPTAPPQGLYLVSVEYPEPWKW